MLFDIKTKRLVFRCAAKSRLVHTLLEQLLENEQKDEYHVVMVKVEQFCGSMDQMIEGGVDRLFLFLGKNFRIPVEIK